MPPDNSWRQPKLGADSSYLILEQRAQRLDELKLQIVG
jgi:hypothetical protein